MPERTEPNDPNRCVAPVGNGQCPYKAEEGTEYCSNHDGGRQLAVAQRRNYLQGRSQHLQQLAELSRPELLKSLDDEIAANQLLLKLTIERTKDDKDLLLHRGEIQSISKTLLELKKANAELERKYKQVLSVAAVGRLASRVVEIVLDVIKDLPNFEALADQIIAEVSQELEKNHNKEGDL